MYRLTILVLSILFIQSCKMDEKKITNVRDYEQFLTQEPVRSLKGIDEEIRFWKERFKLDPDDLVSRSKIASLLKKRFAHSGNIRELHQADSLYKLVLVLTKKNSSGTYRSLANNAITMHRFREAQVYLDSALKLGDDKYLTMLMCFDVAMELGNYARARDLLRLLEKDNSFEIIIRKSKYKDKVEGKQEDAIKLLEQANEKIKNEGNRELILWTKSNLGDMYTHANRVKEAYECYLEVLKMDPGYFHALKGIGWLAYAHDKDVTNARKIFDCLLKMHPVPDYLLQLAQLSGFEEKIEEEKSYYSRFVSLATDPDYGGMYNKYLFYLQCDELKDYDAAMDLARLEVKNRPTPESYALLAWAYFKKGNTKEALSIANSAVENHCFEPDALYHLGVINSETNKRKAKKFLQQAKEGVNELGPSFSNEVDDAIGRL